MKFAQPPIDFTDPMDIVLDLKTHSTLSSPMLFQSPIVNGHPERIDRIKYANSQFSKIAYSLLIMTNSILKRSLACKAWDILAGMINISPEVTVCDCPPMVISAVPSRM